MTPQENRKRTSAYAWTILIASCLVFVLALYAAIQKTYTNADELGGNVSEAQKFYQETFGEELR